MQGIELPRQATTNSRLMNGIFNNLSEQEKEELLLDINMEVIYISTLKGSSIYGFEYFVKLLKDNADFARWIRQKK